MDGLIGGIVAALGMVVIAAVCGLLARMTRLHQLEPNGVIGLRTKATRSSPAAWQRGHDAARPWVLAAAGAAIGAGVIFVLVGALSGASTADEAVPTWSILVGYVAVSAVVVAAGVVADRAAKRVASTRPTA